MAQPYHHYDDEAAAIFYNPHAGRKIRWGSAILIALFTTILILVLVWAVVSTVFATKRNNPYPNSPTVTDEPYILDIIAYNDVYELEPVTIDTPDKRGGASRVKAYINSVKAKKSNPGDVLILCGGDMISPSLWSTVFKGRQMIAANNLLGLNFSAIGNHEFDFDVPVFAARYSESKFTWINSNIPTLPFSAPENVVYNYGNYRIGLFGLTLQFGPTNQSVIITDPFVAAQTQVANLKGKGAQFIIALTHLPAVQNCELASQVKGIDLIVSGHDHQVKMSKDCGDPAYITASQDWQDIWHLRVNFNYTKPIITYNNIPMTADLPTDPEMDLLIYKYGEQVKQEYNIVIATTLVDLEGRTNYVRTQETNLADYIADSLRNYAKTNISYFNGGSIRCNKIYPANTQLTKGSAVEIIPFSNHHGVVLVNGTILKQMLENGVSLVNEVSGRFPVISGFRVNYTLNNPVGNRILSMRYPNPDDPTQWIDIQPGTIFTMCTSSYLLEGGDGYSMIVNVPKIVDPVQGFEIQAIVMDVLQHDKVLAPVIDGRLTKI